MRRVVITGVGVIASPGLNPKEFFDQLLEGRAGVGCIQTIQQDLLERLRCKIGATVTGYDPVSHFSEKEIDHLDRFSQFAIVAARQAYEQSGLGELNEEQQHRLGVCVGSSYGGTMTLDENYHNLYAKGLNRLSPLVVARLMYNAAASQVSMHFQARGPSLAQVSACSSSLHAIGDAFRYIQHGQADYMLAGGSDAPLTYGVIRCWEAMRVLAPAGEDPTKACRPFSGDRQGIVIGEGAGMFLLEEYEAANKRGAEILAEIAGYGANSDASRITQPSVEGPARAMKLALDDAGMNPEEIDYINAHGTSTPLNDKFETLAMKSVFNEEAYKIPISSTKSMTGHLLGASGALEAAISVMATYKHCIPPTINLDNPDPDCDLDYTAHSYRESAVRTAMSNSFGFGGHNASLIFQSFEE